jgi:hypothetical protein
LERERVDAISARDDIGAGIDGDEVCASGCGEPRDQIAIDLRVGRTAEPAPEQVISVLAQELILTAATDDGVIAEATEAGVGTGAHGDEVIAETTMQLVAERAAVDGVVADRADKHVARGTRARADNGDTGLAGIHVLGADGAVGVLVPEQHQTIVDAGAGMQRRRAGIRGADQDRIPNQVAGHIEALAVD